MLKYFYAKTVAECPQCDDITIPQCECGSYRLEYTKSDTFICLECGQTLDAVCCEEGHKINITNNSEMLYWIPQKQLLADVTKILANKFIIDFQGSFSIRNNNITISPKTSGSLLDINSISEFRTINDLEIDEIEKETLLNLFINKKITEKCHIHSKESCDNCTEFGS